MVGDQRNDGEAPGWSEGLIDAHHHFRDLERNHHPWLCDEHLVAYRHGDYRAIWRT